MKILHVSDGSIYNYDGVSTYINELIVSAFKDGVESKVMTTLPFDPGSPRTVSHNAEVIEFRRIGILSADKFNFSLPSGMKKRIREFNPDIIWIHTIGPLGIRAAQISRNKYHVIYTKHCFDGDLWCSHLKVNRSFQWLFYFVAEHIERIILKSADSALYHINNPGKLRSNKYFSRFRYVPPPLCERFLKEKSMKISNGDDIITLGFCGRLDPEKGLDRLFAAVDIYQRKHNTMNIRLLLIGDGAEARTLKNQFPRIDTTITGFVEDVIPWLDKLDAYILSSKTEMYSLSSLEAYSRGLPVFSTPVGYVGQNADKLINVYNFNTPEELASLIHEVLVVKRVKTGPLPAELESSIITFARLHELVSCKKL